MTYFFSKSDSSCFKCATLLVATTEEKRSKPLNNRWKTIETSIRNIDEVDEKGETKKNAHWAECISRCFSVFCFVLLLYISQMD